MSILGQINADDEINWFVDCFGSCVVEVSSGQNIRGLRGDEAVTIYVNRPSRGVKTDTLLRLHFEPQKAHELAVQLEQWARVAAGKRQAKDI